MSDTKLLKGFSELTLQLDDAVLDSKDTRQRTSSSGLEYLKILGSLVPDEIIYLKPGDRELIYNGVLFFSDVSGFTDLCEKYSNFGKGGPSKITQVLNAYIGAMVQEIIVHNGDILKFSGDAFLALFKNRSNTSMRDVCRTAIDCALSIQKSHGTYQTEVGHTLKVKIAIAVGQLIFTIIGGSNFMVLGRTMFEVKDVGNVCGPSEIIITPSVKSYLSPNEYVLSPVPNVAFIKVIGIGSAWCPSQLNQESLDGSVDMKSMNVQSAKSVSEESMIIVENEEILEDNYNYILRPSLDYAINYNKEEMIRKFIIAPVLRAVDLGEPLEYLTEMRKVVIVFINIVTVVYKLKQLQNLCDYTYSTISGLVSSVGGCVNKVSMFDKDLMFLCIFGLRGFKHDLETQRALYCAKKIRDKLSNVHEIISISCGVTTGLTYCGVVGHQMRKEYTVIGRTVNKAARIMVAYPNMVSCDQQSFLASQLQSKYFTLQPNRYLKGFKNAGPVYKFDDKTTEKEMAKEMDKTNQYPLLGRDKELETFFNLLSLKTDSSAIFLLSRQYESDNFDYSMYDRNYKMLVLKGEPRQGKTRLLNEIIFNIQDEIPIYNCTFNDVSAKKYNIFRCIFSEGCNLTDLQTKDLHARTYNVWKVLSPFKVPEFLCALNEILNVRFEVSKYFLALNEDEKLFVRAKMIKYLTFKIFRIPSLILIDNIEFMDDESWFLYQVVLRSNRVFTCSTITNNENLCDEALNFLKRADVITMKLKPITNWFLSALICQFLDVKGIPLELERYVQVNSNGNPGWIESFLTTLVHSKGIEIKDMEMSEAYDYGIVMPKKEYIQRGVEQIESSYKSLIHLMEEEHNSFLDLYELRVEGWDLYEQTTKDSYKMNISKVIPVCLLTTEFCLEDIYIVDLKDVQMLQTYDSLKVHEQQLLKCCSILGDCFERRKLEYVLHHQDQMNTALAIRKLFEINVFSCARGVYNNGSITVRHHLTDPNKDMTLQCECQDFPKNDFLFGLPKYASCEYIRFREPKFRQMLMNLLTEIQANSYHVRAMWYLENQTRKCLKCGGGYFYRIHGQYDDIGMKKASSSNLLLSMRRRKTSKRHDVLSHSNLNLTSSLFLPTFSEIGDQINISSKSKILGREYIKARTFIEPHLTHCSYYNMQCVCESTLNTMYTQMIEHAHEAGKHESLMYALLEFSTLCINSRNVTVAFTLLRNAAQLLQNKLRFEFLEPSWDVPVTRSKILYLQGQLHIGRAAYEAAEISLMASLKSINLDFPRGKTAVRTKIKILELRQKFIFGYFSEKFLETNNPNICKLSEQTSDILSAIYTMYKKMSKYQNAYLASLWNLVEALRSNMNFSVLCTAYCNVIKMDMLYHRPELVWHLENMALLMCYRKQSPLENEEYDALINMYSAIFIRKSYCESFGISLKLGHLVMTLSSLRFGKSLIFAAFATLVLALMVTKHLKRMATYFFEVWNYADVETDVSVIKKINLLSLSLTIQLNTTYSLLPFSEITSFLTQETNLRKKVISPMEMRFYLSLWLWYLRKRKFQDSVNVYNLVSNSGQWPFLGNPKMAYPNCTLVEGLLILCVRKIEVHDEKRVILIKKFVLSLLKKLNKITHRLKSFRSRYLLLKAYYLIIFGKKKKAFMKLEEARVFAVECGNVLEEEWINHNFEQWTNWPQKPFDDNWNTETNEEKFIENFENIEAKEIPQFSLTLPFETQLHS